jgi:hypothetical protein
MLGTLDMGLPLRPLSFVPPESGDGNCSTGHLAEQGSVLVRPPAAINRTIIALTLQTHPPYTRLVGEGG